MSVCRRNRGDPSSLHCVAKIMHSLCFLNNFVKSRSILIIFGAQIPELIWNKIVTKLLTSPNKCHYITLWNTTYVNLCITTVTQALNVMTDWHLWTNTPEQMFKMFAFGFDTCIKAISPLINCLINDALLDSWPCCNQTLLQLINVPHWLLISAFLHHSLYLVIHRIEVSTVGRPQFCVSLVHPPDWAPNQWLSSGDMWGVPLPGCQSAVPVSRIFKKIIQTAQTPSLLSTLINF